MVREGKRHPPFSSDPTADRAKYEAVSECFSGTGGGEGQRLELVGAMQGVEPRGMMEYAGLGMGVDE